MEATSGAILSVVNFMLYSFWFALLVFAIFILYMTFVTIKSKEQHLKSEVKKKEYKEYYRSLLYSAPILAMVMISLYIDIM
jgi:protein-S-isoprenylcysteine O-methyltransferase Ste14